MSISPDNVLALAALTASATGYSAAPGEAIKEYPASAGHDTVLAAAVQVREEGRGKAFACKALLVLRQSSEPLLLQGHAI